MQGCAENTSDVIIEQQCRNNYSKICMEQNTFRVYNDVEIMSCHTLGTYFHWLLLKPKFPVKYYLTEEKKHKSVRSISLPLP